MYSPFKTMVGRKKESRMILPAIRSPFLSDVAVDGSGKVFETGPDLTDQWTPPPILVPVGQAVFALADQATDTSADFGDPSEAKNPLLVITDKERKSKISDNFIVKEIVRASSGNHTWNFARIDHALIDNLQRLRKFLGKGINIIDGYYPPKYLRSVLKVTDAAKIKANPHIGGRAAKFSVDGFDGTMERIGVAAIVACDEDVSISIGKTSVWMAVKQPNVPIEQRYTSYIPDSEEKKKVDAYNLLIDFKNVREHSSFKKIEGEATLSLIGEILRTHILGHKPKATQDWELMLMDMIDLLYKLSRSKQDSVVTQVIAYSNLGYLYSIYAGDKSTNKRDTTEMLITRVNPNRNLPPDQLVQACITKYKYDFVLPAPKSFFDYKANQGDAVLYKLILNKIKTYQGDGKTFPAKDAPKGGTKRNMVLSDAAPDKPTVDLSGKYLNEFQNDNQYGINLMVNQAGNYVFGIWTVIPKKATSMPDPPYSFHGKLVDGMAVCESLQMINFEIRLEKSGQDILFHLKNRHTNHVGTTNFKRKNEKYTPSRDMLKVKEVLPVNLFSQILAWNPPLPSQVTSFKQNFYNNDEAYDKLIKEFYTIYEDSWDRTKEFLLKSVLRRVEALRKGYILPPLYLPVEDYYLRFLLNMDWVKPGLHKPTTSKLVWIRKMLEDFRDQSTDTDDLVGLYRFFGVSREKPKEEYRYKVKLELKKIGAIVGFRYHGKIKISNATDYKKYPNAKKWSGEWEFGVTLYSLELEFPPDIGLGLGTESFDGIATGPLFIESDFAGAKLNLAKGKILSLNVVGFDGELSGGFMHIKAAGKKFMDITFTEAFGFDDVEVTIEPDDKKEEKKKKKKSGWKEFLFDVGGPGVQMSRGSIHKKISYDVNVPDPIASEFPKEYGINTTNYFRHDDGTLTPGGIDIVGRMCAEELAAFSNPESIVQVKGHADSTGDKDYNLALSAVRAANTMQAIEDRLGNKLKAKVEKVSGHGETEANIAGEENKKAAWRRRVDVIINGRVVLSLSQL